MNVNLYIDGVKFETPEEAQTYYLKNYEDHEEPWIVELSNENDYYKNYLYPDREEDNFFNLYYKRLEYEMYEAERDGYKGEAYENKEIMFKTFCLKSVAKELNQNEETLIETGYVLSEEEVAEISLSCAMYDVKNGLNGDCSLDEMINGYSSMHQEDLIAYHSIRFEEDSVVDRILAQLEKHDSALPSKIQEENTRIVLQNFEQEERTITKDMGYTLER